MDVRLRAALVGIAANPSAPPDVLLRLAALPETASEMAWRQQALPDEVTERLLTDFGPEVALALDRPDRSDAVRRRIAEDPDAEVREARRRFVEHTIAAGNRVTPDDLAVLAGPDGLTGLARDQDPLLRAAVAGNWVDMPVELRRELLADPDPRVRRAAVGYPHPSVPEDLLARLLADEATRAEVAAYAALTPEAICQCMAGDEELRAQLAVNPTLPPEARDRLADDPSPYVRSRVLLRQDLPDDRRGALFAHLVGAAEDEHDSEAFVAVAMLDHERPRWVDALPVVDRVRHLDSPVPGIRRAVAAGRDLPSDVVERLHRHDDLGVRRIAARRPDAPGDVLERLVIEHGEDTKHRPGHTEHPNFPPAAFVALAASDDPARRVLAARGTDLPADVLTALARDDDKAVRTAAARHPRLPAAVLDDLLTDDVTAVVQAAGANPALPADTMRALLDLAGL